MTSRIILRLPKIYGRGHQVIFKGGVSVSFETFIPVFYEEREHNDS